VARARLFGTSVEARQAKALTKLRSTTTDVARIQLVKINAKWMREFLDHDPTIALGKARAPVLAITGTKDVQVDADDLDAVRSLVPAPVETLRVDDLDHVLRHEPKPVSNPRRYVKQVKNPIDGRVTTALLSWLDRLSDYEAFGSVAV